MSLLAKSSGIVFTKCALGLTALTLAGAVLAQVQLPTPTKLDGGKVISVEQGRALADKKTAFFIDTRSPVNFGKGHVPGANAIPYKSGSEDAEGFDASKDKFDLSKLPAAKEQALVFYSDGPTGWKSYKAAVWAVKAGYKDVNYMRDGWSEWLAKKLPAEN
ncbi:MAG: rhodanese-like domain-containing protein [Rhodoferax sp.]|nr:rhodanese-like domain-containing protein [Rhodoferax sp.]